MFDVKENQIMSFWDLMTSEYNLTSEHIMKIAVFVAMKNRFKCFFFKEVFIQLQFFIRGL